MVLQSYSESCKAALLAIREEEKKTNKIIYYISFHCLLCKKTKKTKQFWNVT